MINKIIFCGTPDFAVPSLESLYKNKSFEIVLVISQPDKKVGRSQQIQIPEVKKFALKNKLRVLQPEKINEIEETIRDNNPDLIVVVAYGQKIPNSILKIPRFGCINVHASILPKYRGAAPIQSALLNDEKETGITIFKLMNKMDAGDIISQKKISINKNDNSGTLFNKMSNESGELLIETLKKYLKNELRPYPQKDKQATYCYKIKREDGNIFFKLETGYKINNKFRAFTPWPGIYTSFKNKRLKILDLLASDENISTNKGKTVLTIDKKIAVQCLEGSVLLKKVQLEGKKPLSIENFLKGYPEIIDFVFE